MNLCRAVFGSRCFAPRRILIAALCSIALLSFFPKASADEHASSPVVLELKIDGEVEPILATYIDEGITDAANRHARAFQKSAPVLRMRGAFPREVGSDAARAPQLRIIILGFPCLGWRAETPHIRREKSHLLRVTVSASFASIDDSAPLLGRRERWHRDGSHPLDFICQLFSRKDRKNKKRKGEETHTCTEGDHMRIAEPTGQAEVV